MTLGLNGTALDADRTRDELAHTLVELRRRLTPARIRSAVAASFTRRRAPFIATAVGVAAGIAATVVIVTGRSASHG